MTQSTPISAPQLNTNDIEVVLVEWLVEKWQRVKAGEIVCSVETMKAATEIESPCDGYVYPLIEAGASVSVGVVIGYVCAEPEENCLPAAKHSDSADGEYRIVSQKARKALEKHGLTVRDFPDLAIIREQDVSAHVRATAGNRPDYRIDSMAIGENEILVYGTGSQASLVHDALSASDQYRVIGFVDYSPRFETLVDLPVFAADHLKELRDQGATSIHVCLPDVEHELRISRAVEALGYRLVSVFHPSASISARTVFGRNVFVGAQAMVGPECALGDFCRVLNVASVAHHCALGVGVRISDGARIAGNVTIGDGTLIGLNATVNLRLNIGRNVTVVSGASVFSDIGDLIVFRRDGTFHSVPGTAPPRTPPGD
jgi:sugar O-acyltransferase (sialic acid O-acetyltransferase NeuD family)